MKLLTKINQKNPSKNQVDPGVIFKVRILVNSLCNKANNVFNLILLVVEIR